IFCDFLSNAVADFLLFSVDLLRVSLYGFPWVADLPCASILQVGCRLLLDGPSGWAPSCWASLCAEVGLKVSGPSLSSLVSTLRAAITIGFPHSETTSSHRLVAVDLPQPTTSRPKQSQAKAKPPHPPHSTPRATTSTSPSRREPPPETPASSDPAVPRHKLRSPATHESGQRPDKPRRPSPSRQQLSSRQQARLWLGGVPSVALCFLDRSRAWQSTTSREVPRRAEWPPLPKGKGPEVPIGPSTTPVTPTAADVVRTVPLSSPYRSGIFFSKSEPVEQTHR
ncbi:hypothetical protein Drorol1_Dr00021845, partial [Drosera rotundifolia]